MRVHRLERAQRLPAAPDEAFPFFAEALNLERITPTWLGFRVTTRTPIAMGAGAFIEYRLALHRVPVRWRTEVVLWDPPRRFVDVQRYGPYALWHHTHAFEPAGSGTIMRDVVRYALPLGPVGAFAHAAFVRRDLDRIFDYRAEAVAEAFGAAGD